jgi:hypothetical protein
VGEQEIEAFIHQWWEDFGRGYLPNSSDKALVAVALAHWGRPPASSSLPANYIDPEHQGGDLKLLQTFYQACHTEGGTADEIYLRGLRAVLAARPAAPSAPEPVPDKPAESLAARWLLEKLARLDDLVGITVAEVRQLAAHAAAWLRENPPGQPVAIEPRGCPTPGACSCVVPATPPAPEVMEVCEWLENHAAHLRKMQEIGAWPETELQEMLDRAATLLQQHEAPAPAVVPVATPGRQWREDDGACLWWRFPIEEPPWCGDPRDEDWPGYHTHFTRIMCPLPQAGEG